MAESNTNEFQLSYSIETSLGVAGTTWFKVEPDTVSSFGNALTKVARRPLGASRQRRKGCVANVTSSLGYTADVTMSSIQDHIEGFMFATAINGDVSNLSSTAVATSDDSYEVSALTAAQANKFEISTLVWAANFTTAANNGLKEVDADIATSATKITVAENLTDEASPPATARVSFAGYRIPSASTVTWTWDGVNNQATLNSTGVGTLLIALGLTPGQIVNIGSSDSAGTAYQNAFQNLVANDMAGQATVKSITANDVVFDAVAAALQFTDGTSPANAIDILFGQFIRNVATDHADYLVRSYQYEGRWKDLGGVGIDQYSYSKGNRCDSLTINLPDVDKATMTFGMVGTKTDDPTGTRKTGASAASDPAYTTAICTSSDLLELRIAGIDDLAKTSDFTNASITLGNGITPKTVLGTTGAKFLNTSLFTVDMTGEAVFTSPAVVAALNNNETVKMSFVLFNSQGFIGFNIPAMTLGDGSFNFTVDDTIGINLSGEAFGDPTLNISLGVSICPAALPRIA